MSDKAKTIGVILFGLATLAAMHAFSGPTRLTCTEVPMKDERLTLVCEP